VTSAGAAPGAPSGPAWNPISCVIGFHPPLVES
jgi:hypothetical protein